MRNKCINCTPLVRFRPRPRAIWKFSKQKLIVGKYEIEMAKNCCRERKKFSTEIVCVCCVLFLFGEWCWYDVGSSSSDTEIERIVELLVNWQFLCAMQITEFYWPHTPAILRWHFCQTEMWARLDLKWLNLFNWTASSTSSASVEWKLFNSGHFWWAFIWHLRQLKLSIFFIFNFEFYWFTGKDGMHICNNLKFDFESHGDSCDSHEQRSIDNCQMCDSRDGNIDLLNDNWKSILRAFVSRVSFMGNNNTFWLTSAER